MSYVVLQIVVFLLIAAALGFVAGWMFRGWGLDASTRMSDGYELEQRQILLRELNTARAERDEARTQMLSMRAQQSAPASSANATPRTARPASRPAPAPAPSASTAAAATAVSVAAHAAPAPAGTANDDLQRIKGIGPKLEQTLNSLGITRFAQLAALTEDDVTRINSELRFTGRIERDRWIEQARALCDE